MHVLDTHNEKCMCLHIIKFLFSLQETLSWSSWASARPLVKYQLVLKTQRIQTSKVKPFTKFYSCLGMNVQSLFLCTHFFFKSSASVYLLICVWWSGRIPIRYKGSCSANSQETLNRPIHPKNQCNCCVFRFYFKIFKIYTNLFFLSILYFVKLSEENSQIRESTGKSNPLQLNNQCNHHMSTLCLGKTASKDNICDFKFMQYLTWYVVVCGYQAVQSDTCFSLFCQWDSFCVSQTWKIAQTRRIKRCFAVI